MKYNLIFQTKKNSVGSGITARYLERTYPDIFSAFDEDDPALPIQNRIWRLQNPYFYKSSLISRMNDIVMCRKEYTSFTPGKKIVDGYSYYRRNIEKYSGWFPTIYQSNFKRNESPSIGYYARDIRPESNVAFSEFIKKIPDCIPVMTMGDRQNIESLLKCDSRWHHTYNADEFWRSCSHYFYYRPYDFEDPFPQNLLEAIQSRHRIISPVSPYRDFSDGVDDFLSCVEYDTEFFPDRKGQFCEVLQASHWSKFIHDLVESHFSRPSILYTRSFYDWIQRFL